MTLGVSRLTDTKGQGTSTLKNEKKILITGFGPFGGLQSNPTEEWVLRMRGQKLKNRQVEGLVLPVSFTHAFNEFKKVFDEFQPHVVLLTGLAQNRPVLTIERIGINWVDARIPDNDGSQPKNSLIYENAPDGLFTTLSISKLQNILNLCGVENKISTSAGEYVCNDLLYKVLHYTQTTKTEVTFIHFPGLNEAKDYNEYQPIYSALLKVLEGL